MKGELRLADGRRLVWRESGQGRPLVLLHGWSMSSVVFAETLDEFSDGFRVLAPDLRGHGGSEGGPGYGLADFAADLKEWMDFLGLREAVTLGWSLGGEVLLKLYPEVSARVNRMILVGTTPRFAASSDWPHGLPEGQVRAMARSLTRDYRRSMGDFFALQFAGEDLSRERYRRIVEFAVRAGRLPESEVALASLEALRIEDVRDRLPEIDCPVLVLQGGIDRITLPGAARYLAENLPNARLEILQDLGHAPFLSRPEEVFRSWREFLQTR